MNYKKVEKQVRAAGRRSAWSRGVAAYAIDILADLEEYGFLGRDIRKSATAKICNRELLKKALLNGASDWSQYSWGGCSLIYDEDIAARVCSPSELRKNRNGERRPNSCEEWLDVQARALYQACHLVCRVVFPFGTEVR